MTKCVEQAGHLRRIEKIGCAAAKMQLIDPSIAIEHRRGHFDLTQQVAQVFVRSPFVARDDARASAIEARTQTKRDVHIDRQRPRNRILVRRTHDRTQIFFGKPIMELRCGRVRRIARPTDVVARNQFGIKHMCRGIDRARAQGSGHARMLREDDWTRLDPDQPIAWWAHQDLNLEPTDYESAALTN